MTGAVALNVPCGDTKCAGSAPNPNMMMIPGFMIAQSCCADEATSTCGTVQTSNMMCAPPPTPAPKCPKTFGSFAGCCAGDNLCGADLSLGGMGCVELGKFGMMVPAGARNFLMLPPPAHCDDGSLVPMPDAGMQNTGNDAGQ
jgi:hypothetical protein